MTGTINGVGHSSILIQSDIPKTAATNDKLQ
jgi:hypothetical protein